jgi:hypothetical protein
VVTAFIEKLAFSEAASGCEGVRLDAKNVLDCPLQGTVRAAGTRCMEPQKKASPGAMAAGQTPRYEKGIWAPGMVERLLALQAALR